MDNQPARFFRNPVRVVGFAFLLLGCLSLLFLPVPSKTFFWKAVYNFGHVPLFGLVAILLVWMSRMLSKPSGWSSIRHYGIALLGVLVFALLTEALQSLNVERQTSLSDVMHDLVGAMCGLGLYLTYDSQLFGRWVLWREFPRNVLLRVCVVLVISMTLVPVAKWAYAYWDRAKRFPSLVEFASQWEMKFVKTSDSELQLVAPPEGWGKSKDDLVGRVTFHTKKYPGIYVVEPYPDWQEYTYFQLDIYSELSTPQMIAIRIDDIFYSNKYEDGFNRRLTILPGRNHIKIAIEDIRQGPVYRETNLRSIEKVLLFAKSPSREFSLYFDNFRLE